MKDRKTQLLEGQGRGKVGWEKAFVDNFGVCVAGGKNANPRNNYSAY